MLVSSVFEVPHSVMYTVRRFLDKNNSNYSLAFSIENGSKNGDSYSSDIYRLIAKSDHPATRNADGSSIRFVLKMSPKSEIRRAMSNTLEQFSNEFYMYSKVLPELEEFQKNYLKDSEIFHSYPKMIGSSLLPKQEYILLEDMSASGFKNFDRPVPMNFEQCTAVFKALAHLHATSFAFKDRYPEKFEALARSLHEVVFKNPISTELDTFLRKRIDPAIETLNPDEVDIKLRLVGFRDVLSTSMIECLNEKNYGVILHGDCWISNILYRRTDENSDLDISFLDWQIGRYGTPIIDLSYFTFCCTDSKLRTRLFELLDIYYQALSERLTHLGGVPKTLFPESVFRSHVKKYMKFGFGMALMSTHTTCLDQKDMPNVLEILESGNFEIFDALSNTLSKTDAYKKRMSDICRDVVRFGYI